jgi:hypothetical protein
MQLVSIVVHPFIIRFEQFQQTLLVISNIHSGVTINLQQSFLSFPYKDDIVNLFFF